MPRAAPRPVRRGRAKAGPDRVREDVLDRVGKVLVVLDRPRGEAGTEEVPGAAVADVEALCVPPAQELDAGAETGDGGLHNDVVVVRHQAEGVDAPAVAGHRLGQKAEEGAPVVVVRGDVHAVDAARCDVEVAAGKLGAKNPGHEQKVSRRGRTEVTCARTDPLPLQTPWLAEPRPWV